MLQKSVSGSEKTFLKPLLTFASLHPYVCVAKHTYQKQPLCDILSAYLFLQSCCCCFMGKLLLVILNKQVA